MNDGLEIDIIGTKRWYINGVNFTEEEYLKRTRKEKLTELGL